jgi:hypothetical protein
MPPRGRRGGARHECSPVGAGLRSPRGVPRAAPPPRRGADAC